MPDRPASPFLAGLAGALAMTVAHESIRRVLPEAPRLDSLGRRALARGIRAAGQAPPGGDALQAVALAGDVAFNAGVFGAAVALGPPATAPARGALAGLAAGLATLALPPHLGIGPGPRALPPATRALTIGLYAGGGWVAGVAYRRLARGRAPS